MKRKQQGLTLIELTIVIILIGIFAALLSTMLSSAFDGFYISRDYGELDQQAQIALNYMSTEIENMQKNGFIRTRNGQLIFVNHHGQQIRYRRVGTQLMRRVNTQAERVLASHLLNNGRGLRFTYLAADGKTTTTDENQVYYVHISITLSQQVGDNTQQRTYQTTVFPRKFS